jgi:hypothetical protein
MEQASVSSADQGGGKRRTEASSGREGGSAAECATGHARGGAEPSTGGRPWRSSQPDTPPRAGLSLAFRGRNGAGGPLPLTVEMSPSTRAVAPLPIAEILLAPDAYQF